MQEQAAKLAETVGVFKLDASHTYTTLAAPNVQALASPAIARRSLPGGVSKLPVAALAAKPRQKQLAVAGAESNNDWEEF